jgi:cbb3-type cytochrome oxidase maturation protein
MESVFLLIFLMLCAGLAGWLFFLWAVKTGQYDDVERPKYRMLEDEEDEGKKDRDAKKDNKGS